MSQLPKRMSIIRRAGNHLHIFLLSLFFFLSPCLLRTGLAEPIRDSEIHVQSDTAPDFLAEPEPLAAEEETETASSIENVSESIDEAAFPVSSEPSTEVPPAEELLQLKPLYGATARFSDIRPYKDTSTISIPPFATVSNNGWFG